MMDDHDLMEDQLWVVDTDASDNEASPVGRNQIQVQAEVHAEPTTSTSTLVPSLDTTATHSYATRAATGANTTTSSSAPIPSSRRTTTSTELTYVDMDVVAGAHEVHPSLEYTLVLTTLSFQKCTSS